MTQFTSITLQIGFYSLNGSLQDPATVGAEARQATEILLKQGYIVRPEYSGTKGGELFTVASEISQSIANNKDLLLALISLATPILTLLLSLQKDRKKETSNLETQEPESIQIYLSFGNEKVSIKQKNAINDEALLSYLLDQTSGLQNEDLSKTTPRIEVYVPSENTPRRR